MENNTIKNWGEQYREEPKDEVWNRIEDVLDQYEGKPKSFSLSWKHFLFAANLALLLMAIFTIKSSDRLRTTEEGPIVLEKLEAEGTYYAQMYSIHNIIELGKAYKGNQ